MAEIAHEERVIGLAALARDQLERDPGGPQRFGRGDQAIRRDVERVSLGAEKVLKWRAVTPAARELLREVGLGNHGAAGLAHGGKAAHVVPVAMRQNHVLDRRLAHGSKRGHGFARARLGRARVDRDDRVLPDDEREVAEVVPLGHVHALCLAHQPLLAETEPALWIDREVAEHDRNVLARAN